jgi:hypothetical protein
MFLASAGQEHDISDSISFLQAVRTLLLHNMTPTGLSVKWLAERFTTKL